MTGDIKRSNMKTNKSKIIKVEHLTNERKKCRLNIATSERKIQRHNIIQIREKRKPCTLKQIKA
jgi:hypothetical protein